MLTPRSRVELALGTVQFGLAYGIAGGDAPVAENEARAILERAAAAGVRFLDTAPVYGDIEGRLGRLTTGLRFEIVTKIPALPEGPDASVRDVVRRSIDQSRARLGTALRAVLFHRAEDLLGPRSDAAWAAAVDAAGTEVAVGTSSYDPETLVKTRARYPVAVAQMPANVFDRRLEHVRHGHELDSLEIHVRSAFLQGLLLMAPERAAARVPAAAASLRLWHDACREGGIAPMVAALAYVRALRAARACLVGVDSLAQFEQVLAAWDAAADATVPYLDAADPEVIDPRRWTPTAAQPTAVATGVEQS